MLIRVYIQVGKNARMPGNDGRSPMDVYGTWRNFIGRSFSMWCIRLTPGILLSLLFLIGCLSAGNSSTLDIKFIPGEEYIFEHQRGAANSYYLNDNTSNVSKNYIDYLNRSTLIQDDLSILIKFQFSEYTNYSLDFIFTNGINILEHETRVYENRMSSDLAFHTSQQHELNLNQYNVDYQIYGWINYSDNTTQCSKYLTKNYTYIKTFDILSIKYPSIVSRINHSIEIELFSFIELSQISIYLRGDGFEKIDKLYNIHKGFFHITINILIPANREYPPDLFGCNIIAVESTFNTELNMRSRDSIHMIVSDEIYKINEPLKATNSSNIQIIYGLIIISIIILMVLIRNRFGR